MFLKGVFPCALRPPVRLNGMCPCALSHDCRPVRLALISVKLPACLLRAILVSPVSCSGHIRNTQIAMPTPGSTVQMPLPVDKIKGMGSKSLRNFGGLGQALKISRGGWMKRLNVCRGFGVKRCQRILKNCGVPMKRKLGQKR